MTREGKESSDDHGDDAADERDEVGCGVRVVCYDFGEMIVHLYTFLGPNRAKEYPRPNEHDEDAKKQEKIEDAGSCTSREGIGSRPFFVI
jgi:hypothetical protein